LWSACLRTCSRSETHGNRRSDRQCASLRKLIPRTLSVKFAAICAKHIPDTFTLKFASKPPELIADRICLKLRTIDASQKCLVVIAPVQQQGWSLRSPKRGSAKGHEQKRTYRELHGMTLAQKPRIAYECRSRTTFIGGIIDHRSRKTESP
jgi:hypothetical protein